MLYDKGMASFTYLLSQCKDYDDSDREWLHHLVADWQPIADLNFADLMLVVPTINDNNELVYKVAAQCRSSAVVSRAVDDIVGEEIPSMLIPSVESAMRNSVISRLDHYRMIGPITVCDVFAPVMHNGKVLGVVIRETNMVTRMANGHYESESIGVGKILYEMISDSRFPYPVTAVSARYHDTRVSDGFVILSADGVIEYAAPNAVSCFRHLGSNDDIIGKYLSEVVTEHIHENDIVPESLPIALSGKMAVDSEIETVRATISIRSLPLWQNGERSGAVILLRDITEIRRKEHDIETKNATISEIHHRVKNNLQAVSALLRLQARRTKSDEVRKELEEAQRRVSTIAVVHEGLSQTADEVVDFDAVISNLLKMAVEVATTLDQHISIEYVGKFGKMPAQDATPLSLILTELITNCVEHGFENRKDGLIKISVGRSRNVLNIVVEDNGNGLDTEFNEKGKAARASGSGLGTQIINTFVTNDFGGTIKWLPSRDQGTRVELNLKLRAVHQ